MALRIDRDAGRGSPIVIMVDGRRIAAHAGESVAGALIAAGIRVLRHSPRRGFPRGAFCLMGSCQECLVRADSRRVLACQETAVDGMSVSTRTGP